eukprot:Mrub_07186.p1 GENE.Mrub_07186~~Mrub_07186.p1  ORF type:complete len:245 (-),score=38.58 Mrub_07186:83-817(-)
MLTRNHNSLNLTSIQSNPQTNPANTLNHKNKRRLVIANPNSESLTINTNSTIHNQDLNQNKFLVNNYKDNLKTQFDLNKQNTINYNIHNQDLNEYKFIVNNNQNNIKHQFDLNQLNALRSSTTLTMNTHYNSIAYQINKKRFSENYNSNFKCIKYRNMSLINELTNEIAEFRLYGDKEIFENDSVRVKMEAMDYDNEQQTKKSQVNHAVDVVNKHLISGKALYKNYTIKKYGKGVKGRNLGQYL